MLLGQCSSTNGFNNVGDEIMWDSENNDDSIIKPCPFCGGKAKEALDSGMELSIECTSCGASVYQHDGGGSDYVKRCR